MDREQRIREAVSNLPREIPDELVKPMLAIAKVVAEEAYDIGIRHGANFVFDLLDGPEDDGK